MKNKKAQSTLLMSFLVAFMLFFIGMIVVNFLMPDITTARTQNSCSSPNSDGGKALCLILDFTIPYFFVLVISVAGGYATNKFLQ